MNCSDVYRQFASFGTGILMFLGIVVLAMITVWILYLLTLQNALAAVSPQNRKMAPGMVWLIVAFALLGMIPLIGIVFSIAGVVFFFFVVKNIAESLEAEYLSRGMNTVPKPTYNIGMAYFAISLVMTVINLIKVSIPILGFLLAVGVLVCWIVYWVQVSQNKNRLKAAGPMQMGSSEIFGAEHF